MFRRHSSALLVLCASVTNLCGQQPLPRASLTENDASVNAATSLLENISDSSTAALPESDSLRDLEPIREFRIAASTGYSDPSQPGAFETLHAESYTVLGNNLVGFDRQGGAALGGSFHHNRTSYFLGFDRQRLLSTLPTGGSLLHESLLPKGSSTSAQASSQVYARIDHRLSQRDSVNARYARSSLSGNTLRRGIPDFARPLNTRQQSGTIDHTSTFSAATVNETRGQFTEGSVQVPAGAPGYGIQSYLPTSRRFRVYEAADNIIHQAGAQNLQAGGNFLYNQMTVSFLEGSLGDSSFSQSSRGAGFYVSNQWKISPALVLTAGVRYDLEFLKRVKTDTNNLGPQFGFAWSPGGSRSIVIRGGYGLMYQQLPLPAISGALDPASNAINLLSSGRVAVGSNSLPLLALGGFNTVNPSIQNAYAEQANLEVEKQLGTRSAFTATYQHVRGVELAVPADRAAPFCAAAAGCTPGNELQGVLQYNSGSSSTYDGLTVAFVQHPIHWGDYRVSYTYAGGQSSQQYDGLAGDQMQRLAFRGSLHTAMEGGSGIWQRFTHDLALSGYGDITRRSELPGVDLIHLNAQLTKGFRLGHRTRMELIAERFGLLEHRSYSMNKAIAELGEDGGAMLSSYQRFAAIGAPTGIQVGLRFRF